MTLSIEWVSRSKSASGCGSSGDDGSSRSVWSGRRGAVKRSRLRARRPLCRRSGGLAGCGGALVGLRWRGPGWARRGPQQRPGGGGSGLRGREQCLGAVRRDAEGPLPGRGLVSAASGSRPGVGRVVAPQVGPWAERRTARRSAGSARRSPGSGRRAARAVTEPRAAGGEADRSPPPAHHRPGSARSAAGWARSASAAARHWAGGPSTGASDRAPCRAAEGQGR